MKKWYGYLVAIETEDPVDAEYIESAINYSNNILQRDDIVEVGALGPIDTHNLEETN